MPTTKSAAKRMRQDDKLRLRSRAARSEIKTNARKLEAALEAGKVEDAKTAFKALQAKLDKAAKGGAAIHKNKAARRKSRMQKKLNALAAKK